MTALVLVGAGTLISSQAVHGQASAFTGEAQLIPWYRTEVIVFQHLQEAQGEDEIFTPPSPAAESEFALLDPAPIDAGEDRWMDSFPSQISQVNGAGTSETGTGEMRSATEDEINPTRENAGLEAPGGLEFRLADLQAMELIDELQRLQGRSMYQVLAHLAWEQPGYALDEARPFPLSEYAGAQSGLTGEVTLYRGRYLHMVFDLSLNATVSEQILIFPSRGQAQSSLYRITEDRRMRSGELHYIDHPKFGVLLKVTEVTTPPAPESARPGQ